MTGLGKWNVKVKTLFFTGDVILEILDNNGEYRFRLTIPDMASPEITVKEAEEDGTTLSVCIETDLLPGKDIDVEMTFDDDSFDGFIKVPLFGKIKFRNCTRIQ